MEEKAQQLLLGVKTEEISSYPGTLDDADFSVLKTDAQRKAFWINVYNAFYQLLRMAGTERKQIFKSKLVEIGGEVFSLDEIEHGILRKYRAKLSKGFLPDLLLRPLIKDLAVDELDYRIHFALNCGVESCPPIAFYSSEKIDSQLQLATEGFVDQESTIDESKKLVTTTKLFSWFSADFGGKSGTLDIIGKIKDKDLSGYRLAFSDYSNREQMGNWGEK